MEIVKGTKGGSGTGGVSTVTDGVTTVTSATELTFTGATVSNLGGGNAGVTIAGGGTPGGLNAQVQYNNSGAFGGITGATTDGTLVSLNAPHLLNPTINGAGTGLATLTYPNTSSSVSIALPATAGTVALTSQLTFGTVTSVATDGTLAGGPITSTGTLGINLSNANTWSALQTFGTSISIGGVTATGATGTGNSVFDNAPTLITPIIGVATGTSLVASGVVTSDHFTSTSVSNQSFIAGGLTVGDTSRAPYPFTIVGTNNTTGIGDFGLLGDVQLGTTTNNTIGFQHGQANASGTVQTTAGWDFIGNSHTVGAQSTSIAWATRNAGSFGERMRLNFNGNFSIGSTTVTSLFNVGSSAQFQVTSAGHVLVEGVTSTGATGTGAFVFGTTPTIATPVINGISTGTGVSVSATASTMVLRDTQGSTFAINHVNGFNSAATAGGTTTLTNVSNPIRVLTGTLAQTIVLPVTSTLVVGYQYQITNQSTGTVTVQSSGANSIIVMASNTSATFTCVLASGTTASSWNVQYFGSIVPTAVGTATLAGGTVTVNTTAVTASSKIFLTDATTGALTNIGTPTVGTIVAGTSFVINSSNVLDSSNINWLIIN